MDASPTISTVAGALSGRLVTAGDVVVEVLRHRRSDYPQQEFEIEWPAGQRRQRVEAWLEEARALLRTESHPELHGRVVILAMALAEPLAGREIVRSGLAFAIHDQLSEPLADALTPEGLQRLGALPLLRSMGGPGAVLPVPGQVLDVAFSPNGRMLAVGTSGGWSLLQREQRQELRSVRTPDAVVRVGFSRDGRELILGSDSGFEHVRARDGVGRGIMSAGGDPLAISSGVAVGATRLWVDRETALDTQERAWSAAIAGVPSQRIARAMPGRIEVLERDGRTVVADVRTVGRSDPVFSADGASLIVRDEASVTRVDVGRAGTAWEVRSEGSGRIAIRPDATRVAVAGAPSSLLDGRTGATLAALVDGAQLAAFSPDGTRLAVASRGGALWICDADEGRPLARMTTGAETTALAWAPDGANLVTGTEHGTVMFWDVGFAPSVKQRLTAYTADDTRAAGDLSSRLPIDPDVDALAALLAARTVDPPLSVGLFGDWGSGKTFFMRRLRARIAELASDARDSGELQKDVAWHKRIVQIEFNAWHYAEGNLWASLVEHILGNLRLADDEDEDVVQRRRHAVERQIVTQQQAVADARDEAQQALEDVNDERATLETELAKLDAEDPLRQVASAKVRAAVEGAVLGTVVGETFEQLSTALDDTRATLQRGAQVLTPLVRAPDRARRLAALVIVLLAAPVVAWVVARFAPEVDNLAGIVAAVGGAAAWLQRQAAWTRDRLDQVQGAAEELEAPLREAREAREAKIRAKQLAYDAAERKAQEEQARLTALEHELEVTTPSRMLARLIADRVESDDYRRHLGVLALVRQDFEAMSDYLRIGAGEIEAYETLEQEDADGQARVGRIVLYIDDLDRCEPDQVVAVLQAVHLLLAFPLFTVVVGVDVRWVERALRLRHKHLLATGDGAEPRDYLEKIFQIPFWLEPLDADTSRAMLHRMLGAAARPVAAAAPVGGQADEAPVVAPAGHGAAPVVHPRGAAIGPPPPPAPRDLQPEGLEITADELAAMDELAPLLGRSPRALKRFLNTYRLMKVRAGDPVAFLRDAEPLAPYRATLLLLALATGHPKSAGELLDAILADDTGTVESRIDAPIPWPGIELPALKPHAEEVVRFTFHWHGST